MGGDCQRLINIRNESPHRLSIGALSDLQRKFLFNQVFFDLSELSEKECRNMFYVSCDFGVITEEEHLVFCARQRFRHDHTSGTPMAGRKILSDFPSLLRKIRLPFCDGLDGRTK